MSICRAGLFSEFTGLPFALPSNKQVDKSRSNYITLRHNKSSSTLTALFSSIRLSAIVAISSRSLAAGPLLFRNLATNRTNVSEQHIDNVIIIALGFDIPIKLFLGFARARARPKADLRVESNSLQVAISE
jgi:hypothetical protein